MATGIDLSGQTAWVTGGAAGLGRAIAHRLAQAGARVVSLDCRPGDDSGPAGLIEERLDLRDGEAVTRVAAGLTARGLEPDILVNNAGVARDAVVWRMTDEQWQDVLDVNLTGAFRLTRACGPGMRRRRSGAIVNIASINGLRGKFGQANYAASKGGLIAFTKAVARELAREGVRVNAVAPGFVETPLTDSVPEAVRDQALAECLLGRLGRPADIADAVLFLASPLASHITGQVLVVDGGQTL
jgi:3-oxoacyl-[acyl-carrier protein] reductase